MPDLGPYVTAKPMFGQLPNWIADAEEQQRIAAYNLYEAIYWTVPETFKLVARGAEDRPLYLPSGRIIVETMHRYLAPQMTVVADPAFGDDNSKALATQVWTDLARRERFYGRFNANKRYGIMRGDWMFHIYADPNKEPGSKISIFPLDPSSAFPIYNDLNVDEIIGWHIVEQTKTNDGKTQIRRLTYRKTTGVGGPSPITVEEALYKVDDWGGPGMDQDPKPEQVLRPPTQLPSPIDDLPVYLIPNFDEPGQIWGSSEMRGLEAIIGKMNQSISDEDLALALEGLGVYATDAGTPIDDDGNDVPWNLGPGRVVELPDGKKMERITGVSSVVPFQDHISFIQGFMEQAIGISEVAKGRASVEVAESGVALLIELAPLFARRDEKQITVTDVVTNLLFNVPKWYVAYEGGAFNSLMEQTRWMPVYGDPLPKNVKAELDQLLSMYGATPTPIVSAKYVRSRMRLAGFEDMPDDITMLAEILQEQQASADIQGARLDAAVQNELPVPPGGTGDPNVEDKPA